MFDKVKFAEIIKKISETYDNQRDFSAYSEINRTYLSKYMNLKLDEPPKPKTLQKLANASNGVTTYKELMIICNYIDDNLDVIAGSKMPICQNPYIDKVVCTEAEKYLYDIIYTYEILANTNFSNIEKEQIINAYTYIKNDKDYCKYILKYNELKKDYDNFRIAYHKETEGLSDEDIKEALRIYKEIKNRVEKKDNK